MVRSTTGTPALEFRNIHKTYGQGGEAVHAVRGVSLATAPGEFLAITGPSGSGKSTLLNLACGIEVPDAGEVLIDGKRVDNLPDAEVTVLRRSSFGIVFQFFNLLPSLTARENVNLPAVLAGMSARRAAERANELLDSLGMGGRAQFLPEKLSGGEQQRVAIARALVNNPPVILADEPTGSLDTDSAAMILETLRSLALRDGHTVVMVTHSAEAIAFATRQVSLMHGVIVGDTTEGRR